MSRLACLLAILMAFLLTAADASAYVTIRVPAGHPAEGQPVRWNLSNPTGLNNVSARRIRYHVGDLGTNDGDDFNGPGNEFDAIQRGFRNWRNVAESEIDFEFAGALTNAESDGLDQRNVVHFVNSGLSTGILGVTITTFRTNTGEIIDADMELNDQHFSWDVLGEDGTQGYVGRVMVENVVTHEIGHMLGLDHPQITRTALYDTSSAGKINQTILKADDRAPLIAAHPNPEVSAPEFGTVRGSVSRGGTPRFGVEVLLIDIATGDPVIGALSEGTVGPFTNGSFKILNVPPGNYYAFALPVNSQDLGGYYSNAYTDFFPVLHGVAVDTVGAPTLISVGPGQTVTGVDIDLPSPQQNPFEPDNNSSEATPIASGQGAVSRIGPTTDRDWFSFTTTEPDQTVTIRVVAHSFSSNLNPQLTLYGSNGSTVLVSPVFGHANHQPSAANIDPSAFDLSGENLDARIVHTLPSQGTYYFDVSGRSQTTGRYVVLFELSGADTVPDALASTLEAPPGVPASGGDFTLRVTARNKFSRAIDDTLTVELLDVTGTTPVVLDTITGSNPFDFNVAALSSPDTRHYAARIGALQLARPVEVSHYGTLSAAQSGVTRLVRTLNANGVDRGTIRIALRDNGGNLVTDPGLNVTASASAGTLDNGTATGSTGIAAVPDADSGFWHIVLVSPESTGTATVTVTAEGQSIGNTSFQILPRATGTGGGLGDSPRSSKSSGGSGCTPAGGTLPALLLLVLFGLWRVRNLVRLRGLR